MNKFSTVFSSVKQFLTPNVSGGFTMFHHNSSNSIVVGNLVERFTSWVYVCASRNATAVASIPIHMYKKSNDEDKKEEILDHPFLDFWNNPNEEQSSFDFIEKIQLYQEVVGTAYAYIIPNQLGVPAEQHVVPSQFMKIVVGENGKIKGYLYDAGKEKIAFDKEEIVQYNFPNLRASPYGYSPIEAMIMAVDRYQSMDTLEKSLLDNHCVPDYMAIYKGKMNSKQRKELELEFNNAYRGPAKRGKIKIADEDVKIQEIGWSLKDMTFPEGRKWTRNEIADAYGIPIALLDTETVNKANALTALNHYQKFTIYPRVMRLQQKINSRYLPMYNIGKTKVWVEFDNPVTDDYEFLLKEREVHIRMGVTTRNEERAKLNLPPVEGGDVIADPNKAPPSAVPYNYQETRGHKSANLPPMTPIEAQFKDAISKFMLRQKQEVMANVTAR